LTPQSSNALGGFRAQGRTAGAALGVIDDAFVIYEAGAFAILIEAVPPEVTRIIRDELPIPIYSIGAGKYADGQLLIVSDLVGHFQAFTPKFVKRYGDVAGEMTRSFEAYVEDVKAGRFPADEHAYPMIDGEFEKLKEALED
jgi:3-methyl-2-oxobutanoate hydroxymethyltransferase